MKRKLESRFFRLFTGEGTALTLFLLMYVFILERIALIEAILFTPLSVFCFFLLEWILLQGTVYWFLKWKRISRKKKTELHESHHDWFWRLKKTNLVLLILAAGIWVTQWVFTNSANWWALFLLVFAIGEHINYYYIRLSYQTTAEWKDWKKRGWQRSVLARELSDHRKVKQKH